MQLGQALGSQGGCEWKHFDAKGKGGTDIMPWRESTLFLPISSATMKEGDSAPDNSTQTALEAWDPGRE